MELNERIIQLRKERDMTLDEMANKIGVSRSAAGNYEANIRKPKYETLEAIADLFNVDMDYLLGRTDVRRKATVKKENNEIDEVLEALKNRPEGKMLFHTLKGCTKEDILQAVKIIEALKK